MRRAQQDSVGGMGRARVVQLLAQTFNAAVEIAPVSMRGFHIIMPFTRGLPQRNELRVQPDRRRQAVWALPPATSTARGALEHEHEVARQSERAVGRILNNMRNPSDILNAYVGLHGPRWLYVLRMPPSWLLANFRDFEPPEHVPRTG